MAVDIEIDRELLIQLTRDLIRFRSVNPPGNERPPAEFLGNTMRELGLEVDLQNLEPDRANVIGRIPAGASGALVFTGHLDVVPPGGQPWKHDPFGAEMIDGVIYGRGSVDMKGGVAAIVAAMAALVRSGLRPRADIVLAATAGEEAGLLGAQAMVERRSLEGAEYLVVAEPTGLDVFVAEKGVLWVEVRALGRTAHGATPELGVNAVSFLARLIPQLEAYPFLFTESPLLGKPTLSVNIIEGGNKTNVVPDVCRIVVDMRTVPGQDHEVMLAQIGEMATTLAREESLDVRVEIDVENDVGPLETERTNPLVEAIVESVRSVRGVAPLVGGVPYATDAAYLAPGFDMPMVICGPGGRDMLHQPDEHVEVEQLVQAAYIYADLAQRLLR
ncbi:MAG TPA: M20 family metallopeptidase [Chloroflexota bacterium]|nr:M20 family metallopeptidase [Chloroflexota bacterium]